MGGKDDRDGFPDDVFEQMQAGHEKFMRELHDESRRFQQELQQDSKPTTQDKNIFVSFKDFVDTNLSHLAQSFRSLPSNIAELRAKMQEEREARKQEELDLWRRWTGCDDTPDHGQMLKDRCTDEQKADAVSAAIELVDEARRRNALVDPEKVEALFKDTSSWGGLDVFTAPMLSPGGACYYQQDAGYNAPSTAIWRTGAPNYRWLSIDWFKRSPYSPVSLEAHQDLSASGQKWRVAFEDLLNAALDKPMTSHEQIGERPNGRTQSTHIGPGLDWMLSLQCRGILPPQFPAMYNKSARMADGPTAADSTMEAVLRWRGRGRSLDKNECDFRLKSAFEADFDQLVSEIATPAPQNSPETEQDLYDALHRLQGPAVSPARDVIGQEQIKPSTHDELQESHGFANEEWMRMQQDHNRLLANKLRMQEAHEEAAAAEAWFQEQRRYDATDDLFDALEKGDATTAAKCLSEWYRTNGSVDDLIDEAVSNNHENMTHNAAQTWYPVLNEALKRSNLPDDDFWKLAAGRPSAQFREQMNRLSLAEQVEVYERMRYLHENLVWPPPSPVDLEKLERWEQEVQALGLDRQDQQDGRPKDDLKPVESKLQASQPKKVDVLSSLTTSQTTRLPDGTVTTRVVLKQRFADGREEIEEKVHTYQEPKERVDVATQTESEKQKKKGWFWS